MATTTEVETWKNAGFLALQAATKVGNRNYARIVPYQAFCPTMLAQTWFFPERSAVAFLRGW